MSSFLFYDPNGRHLVSKMDPDIVFIRDPSILNQKIDPNNHRVLQVVCICCSDKSIKIEELLPYQHIISIYVCNNHNQDEENPLFSVKVHNDILLTPNGGWEFKGRLALLGECMNRRYNEQVLNELQRLRFIEHQYLSISESSAEVVEQ